MTNFDGVAGRRGPRRPFRTIQAVLLGATAALALGGSGVLAQPALPRDILPLPDQPFAGVIGPTPEQSRTDWPRQLEAPAGAPNILLIMSDDVGFGASSTFGGPVPTPNLDRLAGQGLRFNRFHTTAVCSPTRAALLTGRNSHNVGVGELVDSGATGYPGYSGYIPQSAASVARILQLNGYSTAMFGKHHLLPITEQSGAGPFTQWPTGMGFDYYYGFTGGDVHQWQPRLYRGTTLVDEDERKGELVDKRLADDAIRWIHNQKAAAPGRPFMIYMAPGSLHAPHQAPKEWIARFAGKFDNGWDRVREETFARQLAAGIIPKGTKLTPRPKRIPGWSALSPQQRQNSARMMEVAAAMLSYQDEQLGRVFNELKRMGESQNTLIVFVQGDNGGSGEGAEVGVSNELGALANEQRDSTEWFQSTLDQMGGPATYQNYPVGWAWALNTPFQWTKQLASYLGGMRNGMVVSWPSRIPDGGAVRSQFSHVIDVAPTLLEAAGVPQPARVYGVNQKAMDGMSLMPWLISARPEQPRTQYFQISGALGIYKDGWFAGAPTGRMPWEFSPPVHGDPMKNRWELYDLRKDYSQSRDLAVAQPAKLAELKAAFVAEGERNKVFPLDDRFTGARTDVTRPTTVPIRSTYSYWSSDTSVPIAAAPPINGRSFDITTELNLLNGDSGVVVAVGSMFGGWSFMLEDGKPTVVHALSQKPEDLTRISADSPLTPGTHRLRFSFSVDSPGRFVAGTMRIFDGETLIAQGHIDKTIVRANGIGETFDIGRDTGVPVANYKVPFGVFEGEVEKVQVLLK